MPGFLCAIETGMNAKRFLFQVVAGLTVMVIYAAVVEPMMKRGAYHAQG